MLVRHFPELDQDWNVGGGNEVKWGCQMCAKTGAYEGTWHTEWAAARRGVEWSGGEMRSVQQQIADSCEKACKMHVHAALLTLCKPRKAKLFK